MSADLRRYVLAAFLALALPAAGGSAAVDLTGEGATFPAPIYRKWFDTFSEKYAGTAIAYSPTGSSAGIEALLKGAVDFAGSDIPLSDEQIAKIPGGVLHIPTVIGGVVPIYNVEGVVRDLRFTPETLAGIYLGKIRKWNDPRLRSINHGITLPSGEIAVVHRSDGSGTTFIWTRYLSKVSQEWRAGVGSGEKVAWPVGQSAQGNQGVAELVKKTPNSFGYVEFIYALQNRLSYGVVKNATGHFVSADLTTLPAAAAAFSDALVRDLRLAIIDAPVPNAYPIASFTYLLLPVSNADPRKADTLRALLRWALTFGQNQCGALGYAALPKEIAQRALQQVDEAAARRP